jgi:hypothetical protein
MSNKPVSRLMKVIAIRIGSSQIDISQATAHP